MCPDISSPSPQFVLFSPSEWSEYSLVDSGNGQKLEQFGKYLLVRPEPEAIWTPALPEKEWKNAHAFFKVTAEENGGHWEFQREIPKRWQMGYKNLKFWVGPTASKQVGVFPEQAGHWDWIMQQVDSAQRPLRVLNLFGYTGLATLAAASAGAQVTHLDASRKVITWANENQELSGLKEKNVRWIIDDALKFVQREARRNSTYDGIILDPPKFGRGPKGEVWEFYKLIPHLLQSCRQILSDRPQFVVLTAYAIKASALTLYFALQETMSKWHGSTMAGEVVLNEKSAGRILSTAVFSCWSSNPNEKP
jgi:23S rRNA (cytosine1962-C5)-methyltransferase